MYRAIFPVHPAPGSSLTCSKHINMCCTCPYCSGPAHSRQGFQCGSRDPRTRRRMPKRSSAGAQLGTPPRSITYESARCQQPSLGVLKPFWRRRRQVFRPLETLSHRTGAKGLRSRRWCGTSPLTRPSLSAPECTPGAKPLGWPTADFLSPASAAHVP